MSEAFNAFTAIGFEAVPSHPDARAAALCQPDFASGIVVERADSERLRSIEPAWCDLVGRALEPNVFMDPGVFLAAMAATPERQFALLLAWESDHADARLVGLWGGAIARALLPLRVLHMPAGPHGYLATPVLDRAQAAAALHAMLDAIAAAADLPNILALASMRLDGTTMGILHRVLKDRRAGRRVFARSRRPLLQSDLDGKAYLAAAMSSGSRKKLRQHRRRLAERGKLALHTHLAPADVRAGLEDFLRLEAAGWKGRRGDALGCSPADAAFARHMIAALAGRGDAKIYALCLDGRPVSMQIVLRCGAAAFTWKTAYDEELHEVSPGMLLFEDYTTALLADSSVAFVDSCAFDDKSYMAVWRERETLADLWIDARRGGSRTFSACAGGQGILLRMRSLLKRSYLMGMRTWKKFTG